DQAADRLRILGLIGRDETVERLLGRRPAVGLPDLVQRRLGPTARAVAGRRKVAGARAYSRPAADAQAAPAGRQVREEPEDYLPDRLSDPDDAADPALIEAADAHAKDLREAMASLDDAENLVAVLMASVEYETDSRAMQVETVLKIVREKLREAHGRIDRQDARHQKLFAAREVLDETLRFETHKRLFSERQ
ncbi:MAG TPA: hypothetical protein VE175_01995, partial [Woeseiaceae bacterium]|nr:hypothetical protein [Woeseiaceae bacterium]